MEKVKIINQKGLTIIGSHYSCESESIVIMAHGFTNDKSSNGRFDTLAEALLKQGFDSLVFDFSGSGESDDDELTSLNQANDMESVITFALKSGYKNLVLFGNSFGTLACLKNYRDEVKTMILVGALTDKMVYDWSDYYTKDELKELTEVGCFLDKTSRKHKISRQTLLDFEEVNQEDLLRDLKCPVLIIHGDHPEDEEELLLLKHSRKALEKLPENSKLKVIKNGRHGLRDEWGQVIDLTCDWLHRHI
ncbi:MULTISPECIES: alpha/beta hydrolase [unclassified Fusibacter]|uniref:alpha/beta hydrolase n=1 Tax=unclassified Fusibacter TaxID=2624464 RepID=UPI001011C4B7|nr:MULTISPECIES: alpha/beta hydrolase [unclassified Fusibacter]MCK8060298.1 alpha/beta hydrolase [Fusibacter sp. A2]NPE20413.1 alpha/beta hydrolase [Fusibacter sp. A1]RXV63618.1 alpha/beta hydrolase [Fusibacter sp. A1]